MPDINDKLLNWLSSECDESFADDLSTEMHKLLYQHLLDTPDIFKCETQLTLWRRRGAENSAIIMDVEKQLCDDQYIDCDAGKIQHNVFETRIVAMQSVLKTDYGKVHGAAECLSYNTEN